MTDSVLLVVVACGRRNLGLTKHRRRFFNNMAASGLRGVCAAEAVGSTPATTTKIQGSSLDEPCIYLGKFVGDETTPTHMRSETHSGL